MSSTERSGGASSEGALMDQAGMALGAAGFWPGDPARRSEGVRRLCDAGATPSDVVALAKMARRTQTDPGAFLGSLVAGRRSIKDAIQCARVFIEDGGDRWEQMKARELALREREIAVREFYAERKRKVDYSVDYHIDRTRDPNPIRRDAGLDPAAEASVAPAYRDWRFTVGEIAYWCGRSEDQVREILAREGVDLREGDR